MLRHALLCLSLCLPAAASAQVPTPWDHHPDALNTELCSHHGTSSPWDQTYTEFEASLIGPRGNTRTIEQQVELHQVGGASVVIIEDGAITQHHWYGCRDRKLASLTTADTIYQAASLSKFVAAVGIVVAHRKGDVDLHQSVLDLADDFPDSILAEWVDDKFKRDSADYPADITLRRLLSHTAGLDTHSIGAWDPADVPTMREIILGTNAFGSYFKGGVEPIWEPHTVYDYSGGGFIVAEHILQLQVPESFADYLDAKVLSPAGMDLSTFATATTSMKNLARGCSRTTCSYGVLQTRVKAAGGLLANAREYAELVTSLVNGGYTDGGGRAMVQSDLDYILTPAGHAISTFEACTAPGQTRTMYLTVGGRRLPVAVETCVGGSWRVPITDEAGNWYGLGVKLSGGVLADGFPRKVSHGGSQQGSKTLFELDRQTGDGFVIMINGEGDWFDGQGYLFGADALLDEIHTAYHAVY